jgi:hypothetical protein
MKERREKDLSAAMSRRVATMRGTHTTLRGSNTTSSCSCEMAASMGRFFTTKDRRSIPVFFHGEEAEPWMHADALHGQIV